MKIARFVMAGFGGALALVTMGVTHAEVVTIMPDGSVERSDNVAVQQEYGAQSNNSRQTAPQYDAATPEAAARLRRDDGNVQPMNANNRRDRDNYRDRDNRRDRNRGDRNDRRRDRYGNIIINGNNTDVYINGYPYNYGYPVGGYYGYRDPYFIDPGYGFPYYGGTYSNGGTTITYGNGLYGGGTYGYGNGNGNFYNYGYGNTFQSGRTNPGMGPAWPNMGPVPGMGITNLNPPRLPGAIYNPGRRR